MKIHFVHYAGPATASSRLRVYIPAFELMKRGHTVSIAPDELLSAEVVVFSKHFNSEKMLKVAWRTKNHSTARIVMDVCDDHFDRHYGDHYRKMIEFADIVTVNTEAMQERIKEVTGRDSVIVYDPVEGQDNCPATALGKVPRLLWFGHSSSISAILKAIKDLPPECPLTICTSVDKEQVDNIEGRDVLFVPWQIDMTEVFSKNDIVVVPTENHSWYRTKSCNRAVEAIHAGLAVVAEPGIPDYERLAGRGVWIGNMAENIRYIMDHLREAGDQLDAGQKYIEIYHSPKAVARKWEDALKCNLAVEEAKDEQGSP